MIFRFLSYALLNALTVLCLCAKGAALRPGDLESVEGCHFVDTEWADGDSFQVRFPDDSKQTIRLYGVDCIESRINDDNDAARLRTQRRYFGIAGGDRTDSINMAKELGLAATVRTRELLQKPFTVHTAYADGRGDAKYKRIYAFVTTAEGNDLASQLVEEGEARAFGVFRSTPAGLPASEYREQLKDLELTAAMARRGIWAKTDWSQLPKERRLQREEDTEMSIAKGTLKEPVPINPNTASRDELMNLPGIGEAMALRIIEARDDGPFQNAEDLKRISGIGKAKIESIKPFLIFEK